MHRCSVVLCVNNSMSEMVSYLPISSPFVRFAGRFVDPSFGVAAGWNFFVFVHPRPTGSKCIPRSRWQEAAMVPFEIVACTQILQYWGTSEHVPDGAIIAICIALYA